MQQTKMQQVNNHPSIFKTLARLLSYIYKNNKFRCYVLVICTFLVTAVEIYLASFLGRLIDNYIQPLLIKGSSNVLWSNFVYYLIFSASIFALGALSAFFLTRTAATISQKTLVDLRKSLFNHMQTLSISYFDTHEVGTIMGLYTNDLDTLVDVISQSIPQSLAMIVNIVAVFIAMIVKNPVLTLIVVCYIVIVMVLTRLLSKKSAKYFRMVQSFFGSFNGFTEETIHCQKVIKVFSHEKKTIDDFSSHCENMRYSAERANRYANTYMPLFMNIGNLLYVVLITVGVNAIAGGKLGLTTGALVAFLHLVKGFTGPFAQISQHLNAMIRGTAGADRIFSFLDVKSEENTGVKKLEYKPGALIEFNNVNFSYDGKTQVLYDINLKIKEGEKIAFVGSTGAGKSTIINLLNRFYDVTSGSITIDGVDIREIEKSSLRHQIAVVHQDMHLFTGTIRENILYADPVINGGEVEKTAIACQADDFISRMPNGYESVISGTDCQLSEGQKQLLTIARTYITKAPIIVLDEATSSVDSASEALIDRALDELFIGKTVFMIAHRLSTVRGCDRIVVLEHGRIVEMGTHKTLLENKGRYWELYTGLKEMD